jgi:hypothetical protein
MFELGVCCIADDEILVEQVAGSLLCEARSICARQASDIE